MRFRGRFAAAAFAAALLVWAAPAGAAGGVPCKAGKAKPGTERCYLVGAASRSINPDADGTFAGKPVYRDGYDRCPAFVNDALAPPGADTR